MKVIELLPFLKGFDIDVIIAERVNTQPVKGDVLSKFVAADPTGAVQFNIWGPEGTNVRPGDILRISGAETRLYQNQIQLSMSKTGKAKRIGEHTFPFTDRPDITQEWTWSQDSKQRWEATKDGSNPSISALEPFPKPPANKPNITIPTHRTPTHTSTSMSHSRKRSSPHDREKGKKSDSDEGTIQPNNRTGSQYIPGAVVGNGMRSGSRSQHGPLLKKSRGMIS